MPGLSHAQARALMALHKTGCPPESWRQHRTHRGVSTLEFGVVDGDVFAANYEGELVIKRLVRDAGQWWRCSDNPDPMRYPRKVCGKSVLLIGRVVHKRSEHV